MDYNIVSAKIITVCVAALCLFCAAPALAQPASPEVVNIWPGAAPGTEDWTVKEMTNPIIGPKSSKLLMTTNVTVPTLTVFRPAPGTATGAAVIVCPGGGFMALAIKHEGTDVAQWLAARGITAFVLKYRVRFSTTIKIPGDERTHPEHFAQLQRQLEPGRLIALADGIQAMHYVRSHADSYGIAPDKIGIMGFSAGAITTMGVVMDSNPADRPDFAAPIYGAMEDKAPPPAGPPLFIVAAQNDPQVPVSKSVQIFSSWTAAHLPAELHLYETGGHGFGDLKLGARTDDWMAAFEAWLRFHHWTNQSAP